MEIMEVMEKRHSVRQYKDSPIDENTREILNDCAKELSEEDKKAIETRNYEGGIKKIKKATKLEFSRLIPTNFDVEKTTKGDYKEYIFHTNRSFCKGSYFFSISIFHTFIFHHLMVT